MMGIVSLNKRWVILISIACLMAGLFYPFESTVVPEWEIHLVDDLGRPVGNIPVTEGWVHRTVESTGHEETRIADNNGYVSFPRRTVRAAVLFRIVGTVGILLHQPSGPRASAHLVGPYFSPTRTEYYAGEPLVHVKIVRLAR